MRISKTSKLVLTGMGGAALAMVGGAFLLTGVGTGVGAVMMTSGLAAIGSVVGGGMFAGIGVLAAGTGTASVIAAAIANKLIPDPALKELAESLGKANELYAAAEICTEAQRLEMEGLNVRIGHLLDAKKSDAAELEDLKVRLIVLIHDLEGETQAAGTEAVAAEDGSEVETKPVGDPTE